MRLFRWFVVLIFMVSGLQLRAQSLEAEGERKQAADKVRAVLKENNRIIKTMLDYRYKGGSGAFERDFFLHVDYNKFSRQNCALGTTIMVFTVHCDGTLGEFSIINPLDDYVSTELQKFFLMTKDSWNKCQNSDYEYFEIPIVFTIEGLQTEALGFITYVDEKDGAPCKDDNHYHQEFQQFKDKKAMKALRAIDEIIRRNPYNEFYINEKEALIDKFPKLKKKIKDLPDAYKQ